MDNSITQAELARELGISRAQITKIVKQGKVKKVKGKIPYSELLRLKETKSQRTSNNESHRLYALKAEAESRIKLAQAEQEELKLAQQRGDMVKRVDVLETNNEIIRIVLAKFRATEKKIVAELRSKKPEKWGAIINRIHEEAIAEIFKMSG